MGPRSHGRSRPADSQNVPEKPDVDSCAAQSTTGQGGEIMATKSGRKVEIGLWTIQVVLALLFAFAGVMKLIMTTEALAQSGMDPTFLRFIGVCEALGALGL